MQGIYYIVEHPTRGTLKELDTDTTSGGRFSWSGQRSDAELAIQFPTVEAADRARDRLTDRIANECNILRAPVEKGEVEWEVVA